MNRPLPPANELEPGYEWVAEPESTTGILTWHVLPPEEASRRCRHGSPRNGYCTNAADAELDRGKPSTGERWWAYCADHMYGRWIEDGVVMHWTVREKVAS